MAGGAEEHAAAAVDLAAVDLAAERLVVVEAEGSLVEDSLAELARAHRLVEAV